MEERRGCGSTNIMFDLYLDRESECATALSPAELDRVLREEIAKIEMVRRVGLLDPWESEDCGPATSFHSLQESHVRAETWPAELHVNGEVQLCNFSRNNEEAARLFVRRVIARLNPATAHVLCIKRGPGEPLRLVGSISWERGDPLSF